MSHCATLSLRAHIPIMGAALAFLLLPGCTSLIPGLGPRPEGEGVAGADTLAPSPGATAGIGESGALSWAETTLGSMTLREKAGQLMMPFLVGDFSPVGSPSHDRMLEMIQENGIGGVVMSVGSPSEVAVKLNHFQERSRIPFLVAADLESGAGFRLRGAVFLPGPIDLGGATPSSTSGLWGKTRGPWPAWARHSCEASRITGLMRRGSTSPVTVTQRSTPTWSSR